VQSFGIWGVEPVNRGIGADFDSDRVDDQRVALVMTDGIPVGGRRHVRRMSRIHANLAEFMIVIVKDGDLVRPLENLNFEVPENIGHRLVDALVVRVRKVRPDSEISPRFLTISAAGGLRIGLV
jgi:hypothetical protein